MPEPRGKKPRKFSNQIAIINAEIRRAKKGTPGVRPYFTKDDLQAVYGRDQGRCRYCGIGLEVIPTRPSQAAFDFYRPLKNGGPVTRENLITLCKSCKGSYRPNNRPSRRIENVNTIADLIERLMVETYQAHVIQQEGAAKVVTQLKREINSAFEELADSLQYRVLTVAEKHAPVLFVEEENTLADTIQNIGTAILDKQETPTKELAEGLKEVAKEQKYRILR